MQAAPGTFLSRVVAICVMLCMAAMLHAGFATVQANLLNVQHMASGDQLMADGGWAKACDGAHDDCDGHVAPAHAHDGGPIHHHHSGGETQTTAAIAAAEPTSVPYATVLAFRPGEAARLNGLHSATPDQPPRA